MTSKVLHPRPQAWQQNVTSRPPSAEERALLHLGGALCCRRLPATEERALVAEMDKLQRRIAEREVGLPPREKAPLPETSVRLMTIADGLASSERWGPDYCREMTDLRIVLQLSHLTNAEHFLRRRIGQ
ncbi:hypothetical protein AADZ90_021290 [Aestuariibius sp. 2305UL40-4]|uniref:hypothetical protein n=1 Tax=Aestuariibius violaceus TaxID=3234132 RepID=UPI00345EF52C